MTGAPSFWLQTCRYFVSGLSGSGSLDRRLANYHERLKERRHLFLLFFHDYEVAIWKHVATASRVPLVEISG